MIPEEQTPPASDEIGAANAFASPLGHTPFDRVTSGARRHQKLKWARYASFVLLTAFIWVGYGLWRPPGPILHLRHREHMGRESRAVSLNFDDAPHPVITPLLLASLQRSGVKASFFVVGDGLRRYPELAHRLVAEGHLLANHSYHHRNLNYVDPSEFDLEIGSAFAAIDRTYRAAGSNRTSRMFRPPGGGLNRAAMRYLWRNDIELAWWSNNVGDWARPPGWKIVSHVNGRLQPGDIILLHDAPGGYGTAQAIPAIVRSARRKGLSFVPMPEAGDGLGG
jgi:peptidoglycan/xylan/chitin deacetylase (PgdA/CDA1 family)